ncbi:MAG: GNAT family N-acetyltransferase [Caldimonas sp.]
MSTTTALRPMQPETYATYLEAAIAGYAEENVSAGRWSEVEALARSREDFHSLLPNGLATPDNRLLEILDEGDGAVVGFVWCAIQRKHGSCSAYVFDLEIKPEHRRKGHALRALKALELDAVKTGAGSIGLNVFANNLGAQALYRKLGYVPTNFNMRKPLPAVPEG